MKKIRKLVAILLVTVIMCSAGVFCSNNIKANAASATGVGLSEFVLKAYYEGWSYVYGAMSYGCVDCSGLIMLYNGVGGSRTEMCYVASTKGYMDTLPRIHGLGLWQPGHVGVYIGSGMAVDARDEYSDVCYQSVYSKKWSMWFKVVGVSYPTTGWETFNGNKFYYENGEYLANTTRTIDGVTYSFGAAGTIVSAVNAGGEDVDVSTSTGNNAAYEEATQESGGTNNSSYQNDLAREQAAREQAEREEEEKQRLEEEERQRREEEERLAAEKRLVEAKSASVLSYLTVMADQDPFDEEEPETVAIGANAETLLLKDENNDEVETSKERNSTETLTAVETVVMPQALDKGDLVVNASSSTAPRHPAMFIIVVLSTFAAAGATFAINEKVQTKRRKTEQK